MINFIIMFVVELNMIIQYETVFKQLMANLIEFFDVELN